LVPLAPRVVAVRRLGGAAERALAALAALDKAGTLAAEPREGYDQLVAILRRFWSEQFGVGVRDRTSGELVKALGKTAMPPPALAASARWLERCDLVKYAAVEPDDARRATDLQGARELVYAAVSAIAPPPGSGAAAGAATAAGAAPAGGAARRPEAPP
ncbi:MAG TPA: hypothetical protein VHE35_02630, partial [Kofleriaceae bacterium]|nr:hypothetical protein [Kofleriaceae bacterium]